MRRLITIAALASLLAGCGKNEEQIRAEERAKMLTEQNAELKAKLATAETKPTPTPAPMAPEPVSDIAPEPNPLSRGDNMPGERRIGGYVAFIGRDDLYNSSGTRLTQPWAILRQDRANFHRFGISQPGDSDDGFFVSEGNRAIMERMVRSGTITREARQRIVEGGAAVKVDIYGAGSVGRSVQVTVY